MSIISLINPDDPTWHMRNRAYGNCTCECHHNPNMVHVVACCYPSWDEVKEKNAEQTESEGK